LTVVSSLVVSALSSMSGRDVEVPQQIRSGLSGSAAVALVAYAVILAPITEELVFRGLLFHSIADRRGFWPGAIASSVPFGLIHIIPAGALGVSVLVVTMMITGTFWAWIHWRHGNLLVNIATHATFNAVGVIVILHLWRV
jgi:membrane protease YdiL (CAAX protease family)